MKLVTQAGIIFTSVCLWLCRCVCLCVCSFVNAITLEPFEILSRYFYESSDEFENGRIPMHCGVQMVIVTF